MAVIMDVTDAVKHIKSGSVIHVGGFYAVGTPDDIMDEIIASVVNIFCITRGDVKPNEITQLVGLFEKTRQREIPDAQVVSYFYKSDLSLISTIHQFSFDMIS